MPPKSLARQDEYHAFKGVAQIVRKAVPVLVELHHDYERTGNRAKTIAEMVLDTRRRIINPRTKLPDLMGSSGPARAAYADIMDLAASRLGIEDKDELKSAMDRLKGSVRYFQSVVLVEYLRALAPGDADVKAILGNRTVSEDKLLAAVVQRYAQENVTLPTETTSEVKTAANRSARTVEVTPGTVKAALRVITDGLPAADAIAAVGKIAGPTERAALLREVSSARKRLDEIESALGA